MATGSAPVIQVVTAAPALERARAALAKRARGGGVSLQGGGRHVTVAGRLTREEVAASEAIAYPDVQRPRTRGDCIGGPRPCPFVSCSAHLYISVSATGGLTFDHPTIDVENLKESCSLDAADRGGLTLEEVGAAMGITRERVRQIEERSLRKLKDANGDCYRRNIGWPGDRPWQPILPPMGAPAPATKHRTRRSRKRLG